MSDSRLPVVVYGAAGYVGGLVCGELDRQGIAFAVAGRSRERLEHLSSMLSSRPPVFTAPLEDLWAMRRAAAAGRVLLSCAGPFAWYGKPAQDAAIAEGAHWLDTCREPSFLLATRERSREAEARGLAMVNAVGLAIVPSDAAAALAAEGLGEVEEMRIAVASTGSPTRGTARSMLEVAAGGGLACRDGRLVPEPLASHEWRLDLPPPFGPSLCLSFPLADLAAAPCSSRARSVSTFHRAPSWLSALGRYGGAVQRCGAALARPELVRALAREALTAMPDGPTDEERRRAAFSVVAQAASKAGERRAVWVAGGDGYELTAASAVLCLKLLLAPGFAKAGALSPAQAFGARELLEGLAPYGVRFGEW